MFKLRTTCVQGYISCHKWGSFGQHEKFHSNLACNLMVYSKVHRKWHSFVHQNCSQLSHLLHESHPTVIAQSLPTSLARSRLSSSAGIPEARVISINILVSRNLQECKGDWKIVQRVGPLTALRLVQVLTWFGCINGKFPLLFWAAFGKLAFQ